MMIDPWTQGNGHWQQRHSRILHNRTLSNVMEILSIFRSWWFLGAIDVGDKGAASEKRGGMCCF